MNDTEINDGGPVFPVTGKVQHGPKGLAIGMSLRDYFAGKALEGELSCWTTGSPDEHTESIANRCWKVADAMIKARQKNGRA